MSLEDRIVAAQCRELKVSWCQARPFQVKKGREASLMPPYVCEMGVTVDHHSIRELCVSDERLKFVDSHPRLAGQIAVHVWLAVQPCQKREDVPDREWHESSSDDLVGREG